MSSDFAVKNGANVALKAIDSRHFNGAGALKGTDTEESGSPSFADMLTASINKANDLQVESDNLRTKMIYEPESVDIHQVMIAGQKAEMALTFTKAVRDEALKAYRELMNLR